MKEVESLYAQAINIIDSVADDLITASHHIHENPELNYEEFIASETLARVGAQHGLDVERSVFGVDTALASSVGNGPTVCVMSEYDALPMIGHGCGHNVIATAGLGAAIALGRILLTLADASCIWEHPQKKVVAEKLRWLVMELLKVSTWR